MSYVDAVVFTVWVNRASGKGVPAIVDDINIWALANGEYLPSGSAYEYEDLTAQVRPLPGSAVAIRLIITLPTAQYFNGDPRIFTLGRKIYDDDGEVTDSNWQTALTAAEILQVKTWWESKGYDWDVVRDYSNVDDTRAEIALKIKAWLRNQ